eukprot:TRINITY_DN1756_c0_g1_i1.p1 TRINITY_DN1756_c0_g1~~TRINITY_DN1756_c0_g1_i1.p1  ORF type:complete len:523 (+),score=115.63 TRINITY_DN1756_c0_g1_i1:109-1677(+)
MTSCNGGLRSLGRINTVVPLAILLIGILITFANIKELKDLQKEQIQHFKDTFSKGSDEDEGIRSGPSYTIYGKHPDSGYLKHVMNVFHRAGYIRVNYNSSNSWDVMWAHDYPFKKIKPLMKKLKPWQKVNKLPGSGYVTNKVNLATSGLPTIPKAFKIPNDTEALQEYARSNPESLFVQKNKNHRGIKIEKVNNLDFSNSGSFVQEFVQDPFLVDGYKFDVGVYTMITSIDPLRIYIFDADVLLRFCPEKYHPFDPNNRAKYVVHDDYRPTWKVPTLSKYYSDLGYSFKETLSAHIRSIGKDPERMWKDMEDVIVSVYKHKEEDFKKAMSYYPETSRRMFFEMVRFDFFLDSNLKVYLMEANMSPNLSSAHFSLNRMLYEQVIYSLLRLVGVSRGGIHASSLHPTSPEELEMQVANKDLYVFSDECSSQACSSGDACEDVVCRLCKRCLDDDELEFLRFAQLEHSNSHNVKRIFPPPVTHEEALAWKDNTKDWGSGQKGHNPKMHQWIYGKCLLDRSWCTSK